MFTARYELNDSHAVAVRSHAATQPPGNSPCSCSFTSAIRLSPTRTFFPTVTAAAEAPCRNKELYYVASGEAIGFHPVHILVQLTSNYNPDSITKVTSSRTAGSQNVASYASTCHILLLSYLCPSVCLFSFLPRVTNGAVAYPGILFGGVSTNSVEDRGQGSGGGSPLVRGSRGSCNFVQEI